MFKHKDFDKEQLSAWLDNELSQEETQQFADLTLEHTQTWGRYHMIGQVMREEVSHLELNIADRVSAALENDAQLDNTPDDSFDKNVIPFPQKIWKQVGGYAIAASVAMVALIGYNNSNLAVDSNAIEAQPMALAANQAVSTPLQTQEPMITVSEADRQELQTIHQMFVKHQQLTNGFGLPTVQVVSNQKVIPVEVNIPMRAEAENSEAEKTEVEAIVEEK